jgi:hypothetical protein
MAMDGVRRGQHVDNDLTGSKARRLEGDAWVGNAARECDGDGWLDVWATHGGRLGRLKGATT